MFPIIYSLTMSTLLFLPFVPVCGVAAAALQVWSLHNIGSSEYLPSASIAAIRASSRAAGLETSVPLLLPPLLGMKIHETVGVALHCALYTTRLGEAGVKD